jgi:hypothetical protein
MATQPTLRQNDGASIRRVFGTRDRGVARQTHRPALSAPTISSSVRALEAPGEPHLYVCRVLTCHDTLAALSAIEVAEVDSFVGRDMRFAFGNRHLDFTAENFLLSFSQPNFYFHATTAYDILRLKGLPIGKRDFTGKPRSKPSA